MIRTRPKVDSGRRPRSPSIAAMLASCLAIVGGVVAAPPDEPVYEPPAGRVLFETGFEPGEPVIDMGANINSVLSELLIDTAKKKRISYQLSAAPTATGTDANAMQISRSGVATALVSVPNRYMHTQVEVVSLSDLENCAKLVAETVARIDAKMSFIPQ